MTSNIKIYNDDLPADHNLQGDLAVDTEAMGLDYIRDRLCLVQICDEKGKICIVKFSTNFAAPILKQLLSDKQRTIICHYARFDLAIIRQYLGIKISNIFCTKIASKLVRTYTDSHGLKELCRELLGQQISKQQQSSDWGASKLSKEQIAYAAADVMYLHNIKCKLETMLEREGRSNIALECFNCLNTRIDLDLQGFEAVDIFAHK